MNTVSDLVGGVLATLAYAGVGALVLALVFTLLMAGMIARLFQLQVVEGERYAVVVDDTNSIHLFARATGATVRRYEVPTRPAIAPLPVGDRLLVLDGEGNLTAYYLPD